MDERDPAGVGGGAGAGGGRRLRGRTPEERRQDRREALLAAGLELFGTKGYAATSVEEVCRRAYVTTRNFYAEFANREALLVAVGERIAGDVYLAAAALGDERPTGADGLRRQARAYVAALVHAVTDDPRVARIAFVEYVGVSAAHEATRRRARRAYAHALADALAGGLDGWALAPALRRPFVLAMVGGIDELIADWVLHPDDRGPVDDLVDVVTDFALTVLGSP
jgi:AcrR family transcriptional regulator